MVHKDYKAVRTKFNGQPVTASITYREFVRVNGAKLLTQKKTAGVDTPETEIEKALAGTRTGEQVRTEYFVVQFGAAQAVILEKFGFYFVGPKYYIKGKNGKQALHDMYTE